MSHSQLRKRLVSGNILSDHNEEEPIGKQIFPKNPMLVGDVESCFYNPPVNKDY